MKGQQPYLPLINCCIYLETDFIDLPRLLSHLSSGEKIIIIVASCPSRYPLTCAGNSNLQSDACRDLR
jgi:hypothetical protein